jgi:hypothetical protein
MGMEVLSCDDVGLWMELYQDSDQWRTATLAVLQLRFG